MLKETIIRKGAFQFASTTEHNGTDHMISGPIALIVGYLRYKANSTNCHGSTKQMVLCDESTNYPVAIRMALLKSHSPYPLYRDDLGGTASEFCLGCGEKI